MATPSSQVVPPCAPRPAVQGTWCSVSSQHLAVSDLKFRPSGWRVVESHCRFNLHFPRFLERLSIFCMFMGSLCFQYRALPFPVFCSFFCGVVSFFLSLRGRLCILDTNSLLTTCGNHCPPVLLALCCHCSVLVGFNQCGLSSTFCACHFPPTLMFAHLVLVVLSEQPFPLAAHPPPPRGHSVPPSLPELPSCGRTHIRRDPGQEFGSAGQSGGWG